MTIQTENTIPSTTTVPTLIEMYNKVSEKPIKTWSKKKTILIEMIEKLQAEKAKMVFTTVKSATLHWLLFEENGLGLPYDKVNINILKSMGSECKSSVKCVRWYAVQLGIDGVKLPQRPRSKPVKKS